MTMKSGESSSDPNKENMAISESETQKLLKAHADKMALLEAELKALKSAPAATPGTGQGITADDIQRLIESNTNKAKKDLNYEEGIYEHEIPVEDYLEEKDWVQFCVPKAGYTLSDDRRMGQIVKLPYGKRVIFFDYLLTNRSVQGKHTLTTPVATYVCKSKAERDWIRKHTFYDILIFESTSHAVSTDAEKALRFSRIFDVLKAQSAAQIFSEARKRDLPINENVDELRKSLAMKMVEVEFALEKQAHGDRATEAFKERSLLGRA